MSSLRKRATTPPGSWCRAIYLPQGYARPIPRPGAPWMEGQRKLFDRIPNSAFQFFLDFPPHLIFPGFFWRALRWDVHAVVLLKPPSSAFLLSFFSYCVDSVCVCVCQCAWDTRKERTSTIREGKLFSKNVNILDRKAGKKGSWILIMIPFVPPPCLLGRNAALPRQFRIHWAWVTIIIIENACSTFTELWVAPCPFWHQRSVK